MLSAFGFQAVGALAGTGARLRDPRCRERSAWRWMFATAIDPGAAGDDRALLRAESATGSRRAGRTTRRSSRWTRLLRARRPIRGHHLAPQTTAGARQRGERSLPALFRSGNRRATILASVPWFLQDLGTYGIGIFTPTILAATIGTRSDHIRSLADDPNDIMAAQGAAMIDVLLIVGIIFAVLLADRVGRIRLQIAGFIGCAAGLFLAALSADADGPPHGAIFAGFMLFNFMTNLGPNAQTYLIAGEVFPDPVRGMGAGFAAAFAKVGAVPPHSCSRSCSPASAPARCSGVSLSRRLQAPSSPDVSDRDDGNQPLTRSGGRAVACGPIAISGTATWPARRRTSLGLAIAAEPGHRGQKAERNRFVVAVSAISAVDIGLHATHQPGVTLTAAATNSGAGIAAAISGDARVGASNFVHVG